MNILIVHYNTPELTDALVRSIRKFMGNRPKVYIFDNSDRRPFVARPDVEIIDNTKGQIIDFDKWLEPFEHKMPDDANYGSAKHCKSVDECFELIPDGFILLDSDVLLKGDVSCLWDERYAWCGRIKPSPRDKWRLLPYLCYINVPMCKANGVRYCNPERMWKLHREIEYSNYDTGAWFLEASQGLPFREIRLKYYIVHYNCGSWSGNDLNLQNEWLNKHIELWER